MSRVISRTVTGREAVANLLIQIAADLRRGLILEPPSISPAPHLGPDAVRVQVTYNLAAEADYEEILE